MSTFREGGGWRTVGAMVLLLTLGAMLYMAFVTGQENYRERVEEVAP